MKTLSDGTMLLWGVEGDNASRLFRLRQGRFIRDRFEEELTTEADIHVLAEFDDTLLLLTRADNVFQYQLPDLERIFRYSALGLETVVGTERYGIVVGKSRTDAFDAAVLTIDPVTRETVPLETETFLVYDLEYDRSKGHLYALGITRNGGTHTTVTRFSGSANLTRRTELYRVRGEYLEGDLAVDPVTGALYTSVGPSGITRITEEETETHAGASHAPTRLESSGGFLWAHNRDGSVTLWNPERAQIVGDLYFFEDEGWALLTEEGRFYASSPQAEEFIQAVSASGNTESLQLTLPEE
jgi:PAS domain-containing protein